MTAQTAYEAYKESLHSRTRGWHILKAAEEHVAKSDADFDAWLRENKSGELNRYFMGEYDAMPPHTKTGWVAFAEHAAEGAEAAWTSYVAAARLNFHGDAAFILPAYDTLAADQKDALEAAVAALRSAPAPG